MKKDDSKICKCYSTREKNKPLYNIFSGNIMGTYVIKEGFCLGTRERDACNCQGNENKCDFYRR